jgi:hypothetical protein
MILKVGRRTEETVAYVSDFFAEDCIAHGQVP